MAHQSTLAAEGADEHDHYWELVWANLVSAISIKMALPPAALKLNNCRAAD